MFGVRALFSPDLLFVERTTNQLGIDFGATFCDGNRKVFRNFEYAFHFRVIKKNVTCENFSILL